MLGRGWREGLEAVAAAWEALARCGPWGRAECKLLAGEEAPHPPHSTSENPALARGGVRGPHTQEFSRREGPEEKWD